MKWWAAPPTARRPLPAARVSARPALPSWTAHASRAGWWPRRPTSCSAPEPRGRHARFAPRAVPGAPGGRDFCFPRNPAGRPAGFFIARVDVALLGKYLEKIGLGAYAESVKCY